MIAQIVMILKNQFFMIPSQCSSIVRAMADAVILSNANEIEETKLSLSFIVSGIIITAYLLRGN
jgi:hypothetical protein